MSSVDLDRDAERMRSLFDASSCIWITSHESPDGDSIGAALALESVLRRQGKRAFAVRQHPFPSQYEQLPGAERLVDVNQLDSITPPDVIVAVDIGSFSRIGKVLDAIRPSTFVINIDHHLGNEGPQRPCKLVEFVDARFASTTMLVYELLRRAYPGCVEAAEAMNLYIGLITDTGCFRHSNTTAEVLRVGSELAGLGARPGELAETFMFRRRPQALKLLARVLGSIDFFENGRIATVELTLAMLAETGARMDETEGFVNYATSLDGVHAAVLLREVTPQQTRMSLRSTDLLDVAEVARKFGGGGHRSAAGMSLDESIGKAKAIVVAALAGAIHAGPAVKGKV